MKNTILMLLILTVSCSSNKERKVNTGEKNGSTLKSKTFYYKKDTTLSLCENFDSGYVDTFSINNFNFRIRLSSDSEISFLLERYNKDWILVENIYPRMCDYYLYDLNKDGYLDLFIDGRWTQNVYLFNHEINNFINCGYFSTDDVKSLHPVSLRDSLFYDKWDNQLDNWWSYLFTIKNGVRYNLGIVEYKWGNPELYRKELPHWLSVRQISNDSVQTEISTIKNIDFKHFDVKGYWQKEFKKFYPNPDMKPNLLDTVYDPYPM